MEILIGIITAAAVGVLFGLGNIFMAYGRWREQGPTGRVMTFADAGRIQEYGFFKKFWEFLKDYWHGYVS